MKITLWRGGKAVSTTRVEINANDLSDARDHGFYGRKPNGANQVTLECDNTVFYKDLGPHNPLKSAKSVAQSVFGKRYRKISKNLSRRYYKGKEPIGLSPWWERAIRHGMTKKVDNVILLRDPIYLQF